jgi:hypothetical protein
MNKRILFIIGGVLLVALLAGGAFMAMRLLNTNAQQTADLPIGSSGRSSLSIQSNGPGGKQSFSVQINPSPDLPKRTPELRGMVTQTKDNSIFVGQQDKMTAMVVNGQQQAQPTPEGPYTEVVVSKDTKVYRDVTMDSMPDPSEMKSGETTKVDQKLELTDISAIVAGNSQIEVWGQMRGDRLIAEVILVHGLAVKVGGPSGQGN